MNSDVSFVVFGWNPIAWVVPSSRQDDSINGIFGKSPSLMVSKTLFLIKPPRLVMLPSQAMELFTSVLTSVLRRQLTADSMPSSDGQPHAVAYDSTRVFLYSGSVFVNGGVLSRSDQRTQ